MLTNQLSNFSDLVVEGSVVGVDGRRCHAPPGDEHWWMMVMVDDDDGGGGGGGGDDNSDVFFSGGDGGRCRAPLGTVDRL